MLKAIIVDDEANSRLTLSNMLTGFCEDVEVLEMADSIPPAVAAIIKHQPDLVFLDIEMPRQNGFELFQYFDPLNFDVIFTTAYNQYAVKAFKFSAVDYLLKPIDLTELREALQKVQEKRTLMELQTQLDMLKSNLSKPFEKIALPTSEGFLFMSLEKIIRCEAEGNYTNFYLNSARKIVVSKTLKEYSELLSDFGFFRIHRSHLINLQHIKKYTRAKTPSVTMSDDTELLISPSRKEAFLKFVAGV